MRGPLALWEGVAGAVMAVEVQLEGRAVCLIPSRQLVVFSVTSAFERLLQPIKVHRCRASRVLISN